MDNAQASTATQAAPKPAARLCLLGRFSLQIEERQSEDLASEKVHVLLALLALRASAWEREELALLLWPDSETAQARANLRRALFDLREMLGERLSTDAPDRLLVADKRQIQLRDDARLEVDARLFAQCLLEAASESAPQRRAALEAARRLYGGALLPALRLDQAPGVASWLQPRREAMHRQAMSMLLQLAECYEQQAQLAEALNVAREALALEPLDEIALQHCLRLMGPSRRDEALRLFNDFSQRLNSELGITPLPETLSLVAQLRSDTEAPKAPSTVQRRRVVALVMEWQAEESLSQRMDAEEVARLLSGQLELAADKLRAAGGWLQRAEDAELLAYFGHPEAQEHAVRQALNLVLDLLAGAEHFQLRAGLHVGWVHARADASSPDSLGELSREARRLCWLSAKQSATVSAALLALARRHHRFGPTRADGHASLLGALPLRQRWLQPSAGAMVGRDAELARLQQAWQEARNRLLAVWVHAEPGLGKTRLLQALRAWLAEQAQPPRLTVLHCQPEHSHSPLRPVIDALRQTLQQTRAASVAEALQRLAVQLALPPDQLDALEALLKHPQSLNGGASAWGREVFGPLEVLLNAWGRGQAQLLMIEDLHWADPTTMELLVRYLQRPDHRRAPGLLVLSSREPPPLLLAPQLITLELQALPDSAMRQLAAQLQLPQESQLLANAQGVPLFAHELASSWQQQPLQRVPATLWDLLAARLDRLPASLRRLAQIAAVLGSDWNFDLLLSTVEESSRPRLPLDLQRLQAEGLLHARPDGHWQFRHALQREAAYESLGSSDRQDLHRRAAAALLGPLSLLASDEPALLAHHLSHCKDPIGAYYWLQAGRRAAAQSSHQEACHALNEGLALLDALPGHPSIQAQWRPQLLLQLGFSRLALEGYGSAAGHRHLQDALQDAYALGPETLFQIRWGLWLSAPRGPDQPHALELAQDLLELAHQYQDEAGQMQARSALGSTALFGAQLQRAEHELRLAVSAMERLPARQTAARFGEHGGIVALALLSCALAWQDKRDEALQCQDRALGLARELGHAHTLGFVLAISTIAQHHWGDVTAVERLAEEMAVLADRHAMRLWQVSAAAWLGWVASCRGSASGLPALQAAVDLTARSLPRREASCLALLCDALLRLNQPERALELMERALQLAELHEERYLRPVLWTLRADALTRRGEAPALVEQARARARAHAQAMQAHLWLRPRSAAH